jgi:hypothetical protein
MIKQILNRRPPNYDALIAAFPAIPTLKPIFCYGDTIFNPFDRHVTEDLIVHENIHSYQQAAPSLLGPDNWYQRYISDPAFRLEQEVEAYRAQYAFFTQTIRDRNLLFRNLQILATSLSSPLYGSLLPVSEARELIKNI